jgi:AcrR family transcriptional regulator
LPRDEIAGMSTPDLDPRIERTTAAILAAAFDLLIAEGTDGVTHGQVAAAANVSRTTVYSRFPRRADLLRAAIEEFGQPIPTELTGDTRHDLIALLADIVSDLADDERSRAIATMMERAQHDPTVAEVRDDLVCGGLDMFAAIVEAAVADGTIRDDIDVDLAMAGLVGTFLFRRFMVGNPLAADEVDRVVDDFLRCHATR